MGGAVRGGAGGPADNEVLFRSVAAGSVVTCRSFSPYDRSRPPLNDYLADQNGDSGSPHMVPYNGALVFIGGATTSGPSYSPMQTDMNTLSSGQGLNPANYQMTWAW